MLAMKRLHVTFLVVAMIAFCGITSASTVNMALTNVLITGFDGHSNFMSIMTIQPSGGPSLIGIDGLSSLATLTVVGGTLNFNAPGAIIPGSGSFFTISDGSKIYTARVDAGTLDSYGFGWKFSGLTDGGSFSSSTFGGLDVSSFSGTDLLGTVFDFDISSTGGGTTNLFVDVFSGSGQNPSVPTPMALLSGTLLMGLVVVIGSARRMTAQA